MTATFSCDNLRCVDGIISHPLHHTMDPTEFTKIYSILGVFQDDGWEVIRAAYKKQIKRWHPDRFQDPVHLKIAEEKSKEINHAYQKLSDYYEKFGALPPDYGTETTPVETRQETENYEKLYAQGLESAQPAQPATHRSYIPLIVLGVTIALGYSLWEPVFLGQTENLNEHSDVRLDGDIPSKLGEPENIPPENRTTYTARSSNASENYRTALDVENAVPAKQLTLITKGSSKGDVLLLQGPPERQTETAWDYGASRIYFQAGHVSGWHENPMNPLNIAR